MSKVMEKAGTEIEVAIEAANKILAGRRDGDVFPDFSLGEMSHLWLTLYDDDGFTLATMFVSAAISTQSQLLAVADAAVHSYRVGRDQGLERGKHAAQAEMKKALGL